MGQMIYQFQENQRDYFSKDTFGAHFGGVTDWYLEPRAPKNRYDFVDTVEAGQGLICSPGHDAQTIARAADREEDVGYDRALQASEHRMMTSIEELNLRTDRRDIRLEIDVVRGQRTTYETELQERFQELALMCTKFLADETEKVDKYISGLLDNIHGNLMSIENKRKADDSSRNNEQQPHNKQNVARTCTADPGEKKVYTGDLPLCTKCNYHYTGQCAPKCGKCKRYGHTTTDCQVNTNNNNNRNQKDGACYECGATLTWWNGHVRTLGHDAAYAMTWGTLKKKLTDKYCPKELALMCTKFLADETEKVDKYFRSRTFATHIQRCSKGNWDSKVSFRSRTFATHIQRCSKGNWDSKVMDVPTLPVSAEKNLGDPIEIRVDIVHPVPTDVFPTTTVVRTLAQHGEAIRGIHGHLQGFPINEEMNALRFRMGMAEEENASLRGRIKTIEAIDTITRKQEKRARMELERQLASVQESQRQDQENFRKL
nr:hypothetical protein [Tanacetum cinerariifolium]